MKKYVIYGTLVLSTIAGLAAQIPSRVDERIAAEARRIHERILTVDSHVDVSPQLATPEVDPASENSSLRWDLLKMEKGGLKGVFLAVFVAQRPNLDADGYAEAQAAAMVKFDAIHRLTRNMHSDRCELATSPDDVQRIARTGKRIILIGIENGYPVGEDLSLVRKYYDLGARYITLCHGGHNQICDSSSVREPLHNGLSEFGRKVVAEMNGLGMMIDVSHISEKSFWDTLAVSKAPIIASHSGCAALCPHDRNLTDDQLRALARNGGVIQVVALGSYLKSDSPERREALDKLRAELGFRRMGREEVQKLTEAERAEIQKKRAAFMEGMKAVNARYPSATLEDFVNHIDHAVKIAGIDHVGIGTDFDGGGGIPGFNDESEAPNVTAELVRRGYSESQIGKIWGGNLMRVWREVERHARAQSGTPGRR